MVEKIRQKDKTKGKRHKSQKTKRTVVFDGIVMAFWGLWAISIAVVILLNLNKGLDLWPNLLFLCVLLVIVAIRYRKKILNFLRRHPKMTAIFGVILILLGIGARAGFMTMGDRVVIKNVNDDVSVHWYGAREVAIGGQLETAIGRHDNMFPYLMFYTRVLALFMKAFGTEYWVVIFANIVFDVIAMLALFLLLKLWKGKWAGLLAMVVWAINPLQIIFCSMPLAIVATNMMVIVAMTVIYYWLRNREHTVKMAAFSLLSGILLAIGNGFRPVFTVFLIAVLVVMLMMMIGRKIGMGKGILGMVMLLGAFMTTGFLINNSYYDINPEYDGTGSKSGWSVFVGGNFDRKGQFSTEDWKDEFLRIAEEKNWQAGAAQAEYLQDGLRRYQEIVSNGNIALHMVNKATVLFADTRNSIVYLQDTFGVKGAESVKFQLAQNLVSIYYYGTLIVLGIGTIMVVCKRKAGVKQYLEKNIFLVFLMIAFVGLFAASLLVEVMGRYVLPFVAIMVIIGCGLMADWIRAEKSEQQ